MPIYVHYKVPLVAEVEVETGEVLSVHLDDEAVEGPLGATAESRKLSASDLSESRPRALPSQRCGPLGRRAGDGNSKGRRVGPRGLECTVTTEPERPNWSRHLPVRGPGDLGPIEGEEAPVFAFDMTAVRVEVDPRTEEVIEVIVDEGTMERPMMVARPDGSVISGADRNRVNVILSRAERPTWDFGTTRHGPALDGADG